MNTEERIKELEDEVTCLKDKLRVKDTELERLHKKIRDIESTWKAKELERLYKKIGKYEEKTKLRQLYSSDSECICDFGK